MDRNEIKRIFYSPPVRYTERLILRPVSSGDVCDMYEYSSDPDVTRYLVWEPHRNIAFTKRQIKNILNAYKDGRYYDWALELKCNGKMIGTCGFTSFDHQNNACEIGYVLNPRYHGYSLATEAALSVTDFAFETLKTEAVFARCMIPNLSSRRVMEKCGMTFDKAEKRAFVKQNRQVDVLRYSISSDDYFKMKQGQARRI